MRPIQHPVRLTIEEQEKLRAFIPKAKRRHGPKKHRDSLGDSGQKHDLLQSLNVG